MLVCMCMLTTTLASCAFLDAIVDIFTPDDSGSNNPGGDSGGNTPGGDTPGGDTPGGDTETTYYKVSFAVALEEYKSRVSLPEDKLYKEGTEIQYLPTPAVKDLLFMGWYYDAAMTAPVNLTDKVNSDLMLYAKVVDTSEDISVVEGVYYHTAYDVDVDYVFSVKAESLADLEAALSVENISSAGVLLTPGTDYTITDNGDGSFTVDVNYKAGKTYRVNLAERLGLCFIVDGVSLSEQVTTLNVLVAKEEVSNLQLADGLIYIPMADVSMLTDVQNGLVSVSNSGATVNSGDVGYFLYDGATLKSGDKVAIYEGDIPTERDFGTDNGAVKYLTITGAEQNNIYKFRVSDSKEILFIPDIIPVPGRTNIECDARIPVETFDFSSDLYKQLGMNEDTVVEVGDYIAFFDGPMAEGTEIEYVRITDIRRDNIYYYVDYTIVTYDEVIASMDIYHTRTNTPDLSDDQVEEIKDQVYSDAISSGFVEEAADYLVNLYVSTEGLAQMPNGTEIRYVPKSTAYRTRSGGSGLYYEITKCEAEPNIKVGDGVLQHFEESDGIRVELTLSFEIEFTIGEDGQNKVVISAEAVFEEEILLSLNVDGAAVWDMAWIFPYIVDYEMNANIDIGTYTGVNVIAKVYTNNGEEKEEEEDDDSFFPDFDLDNIGKGDSYEEKAKNIGEELKKLFELNDNIKEEIEGEEEDDTGNDITEKYAEMMKEANEAWIEIVRVEIFKQSVNLDSLGILWFEIGVDFVVSAQLYIMAGIEVETGVAKRYNFSVTLFERTVKTDVIDLEKAHFSFKFYCMGTAGIKIGFELELSLALLSSDVSSVGISAELGVSLGIWGYFYYSYEKEAGEDPEIQKAGAMFFELGVYIEVKFKAHLFNIEKLTYNPTLYENLWPIYSVGSQENVFAFEDYTDYELTFTMQGTNSIVLPDYIFRMKYLDLKDGKYYSGKESGDETPSKTLDDDTESRFLIEISDSRFSYNPKTNTLSTTVDVQNMDVNDSFEIKIQITYKHGALAFNQEVITREITVQVKNNADYGYIYVGLDGPDILGANGPGGTHTYAVKHGEAFTVDMLPKYNVYNGFKFVKWIWLQNYRDVNGKLWVEGDDFVGLDSVERKTRVYVVAVWEPLEITNTVRIFKETVGGAYVYDRTETVSGLAGSFYNLYKLAETGYTVNLNKNAFGELCLKYEGICDLYLERSTQTIRYLNVDGNGTMIQTSGKSGSALVPPVVSSRFGYEFVGWAEGYGSEPCVMPETVPYVDRIILFTAIWKPVSDVEYTVKHYLQNASDDGFELYMTEYLTGYYMQEIRAADHRRSDIIDLGYIVTYDVTPDYKSNRLNVQNVELDGSTVLRVYYARQEYTVWKDRFTPFGYYRHGQLVDTTVFEDIPSKTGYRFAGWDANGDGVRDDTFIMPKESVVLEPLWEGVEGTEYKVIHMVKDANSDNYVQAGFEYKYGVNGTVPSKESIYSDKYIVDGQFVANYDAADVKAIAHNKLVVMYAYYDRVEYNAVIKAYDPETGELVKEKSVAFPYGRSILDKYLPKISEFDIFGYNASRYTNSGYSEMPDHNIEIEVVYTGVYNTPFVVNHYKENIDGTFSLYKSATSYAQTGMAIHNSYRYYSINAGTHFNLNTDMIEETYVERDGSTVFNLYYVRDKLKVAGTVHKLDADGNEIDTMTITEWYLYGEKVIFDGYFDHYVYQRAVYSFDFDYGSKTKTTSSWLQLEGNLFIDIFVVPQSGVPYTVNHWIENVDGTGYEIYYTRGYTASHGVTVSAADYIRSIFGFEVDTEQLESIVIGADTENNLNVYYKRNIYEVSFANSMKPECSVSYQLRYGEDVPAPPTDTTVPGYDFVKWNGYTEGSTVSRNVEFHALYELSTNTPYKVNHYVMDIDGNYQLMVSEDRTGSTNSVITAKNHIHPDYSGVGYTLRENTSAKIGPDGKTVLDVYYDRESFRFSYHYYVGGKIVNSIGELIMHGAATPDSIYNYIKDYPEYGLESYSMLQNGEYVVIDEIPAVMGQQNIDIRVTLKAIGPEVTIVHKVMNVDGETYTETRETFLAIPFEELDLTYHLLPSANVGFTYRIPVNNQVPDALKENVYEIYYDRNTYTVKYVSDYKLDSITESYLYGANIGESPVFTRPGYTQSGWNATIPETMPARDLTFTTTWQVREAVPVTIVHMMTALDGNGYVEKHREVVTHVPELMIYGSNYATVLLGGTYKSADKKIVAEDGSTEICVYYTRNEYTVRFTYGDYAGAGEDVVLKLPYESPLSAPDFKLTGYNLVGWNPDLPDTMPAENITYIARWALESVNVTVNHWIEGLDGENAIAETETVAADNGSKLNGASYKKTFEGFTYSDADKDVVVNSDGSTVVNVYYSRNSYKVTYTYGDKMGNAVEHTVKYGAALPEAPVFTVVGYSFAGWDSDLASTMPASDLIYVAKWTAGINTEFTVEHYYQNANDDGYTVVDTEIRYGTTESTVNGANYKKNLAEAIFESAESKTVNADGSTVIKIYYVRTSYTLTFTYGDKAGERVAYTLRYGQSISYNPAFTVEGYVFAGWDSEIPATMPGKDVTVNATWTAGDGVKYKVEHYVQNVTDDGYTLDHIDERTGVTGDLIDGATLATMVGGGIVLKNAESKAILADGSMVIKIYYDRLTYTVTYSYGTIAGESTVHSVRYGAALPAAPVFSAIGYTFEGWDSAIASSMPASNLTYVAIWSANTDTEFTVEHYYQNANDDGYTIINSETMQGTTASTVNGADFKCDLAEAVFERADNAVIAPDGSTIVRVYYVRTSYTLTFKCGFVSQDEKSYTVRYGATLPAAPAFSAIGYTFGGWIDEEGLYVDEFEAEMPARDLVYTAYFMANEDTPFQVEQYIEQANGNGYDLVGTETHYGRTDSMIDDPYGYVIHDDGEMYIFERFNNEELVILPDGSAVLKVYYQRVRYTVTFYVVDQVGSLIDSVDFVNIDFKYGQTITPPEISIIPGYEFVGYDSFYEDMPAEAIEYYIIWSCIHKSTDGDHQCDRCWESLECVDNNDDGHCDFGREPMDPDDHRYVDGDLDHICDICCGSFTDLCFDGNRNGECDVCGQYMICPVTGEDHRDNSEPIDHLCDDCGIWMSYLCHIIDGKHECDTCYARFYDMCTDEDGDCWCDECIDTIPCVDEDGDGYCDVCKNQIPCEEHVDEDQNALCDRCVENLQWCDEDNYLMHDDSNHDHFCDYCGLWLSYYCFDWNDDGRCEECCKPTCCMQELGKNHVDGDGNHFCDECGTWMSYVCVDSDGDWLCDECGTELMCWEHVDEDENAACDICGEETKCKENLYDTYHDDSDSDHTCDWCGVWMSFSCIDDDYDGHCDECNKEFVCDHIDRDEDNYCDRCYRIINCTHDEVYEHYCYICNQKVSDCYDDDGDLWCDECYMDMPCQHVGMEGEHICLYCYDYLSDCADHDGDGQCGLSEYFPHSISDRA